MNRERKKLCLDYLKARKAFLDVANEDEVLHGNDNIIGRIGEAIAHSFLEQMERRPKVITHQSNPGYDIICEHDNSKISVKMITAENKYGHTSKIKPNWDELIGIELGADLKVKNFGLITKEAFYEELKRRNQSSEPNFSRSMFKENGLFALGGIRFPKELIEKYNLI
ncbi:hypothetical protein DFR65_10718 [Oceanihabitans sediminis]|uniref:Uncharacterized protein n=1 Tax=Oceanihabitans sediminis TaxID=1812012 RepID=A0A368P2V4_9FLAO|nr:hypothetical protein [Oceanihabitans sediminis]RBP28402.1 hypothetical protein DFR65_10718 [Oceanihabitans sediminis]RCU56600.1 hypothetical protein DU428_11955 [Oceanihabitans sediminis]